MIKSFILNDETLGWKKGMLCDRAQLYCCAIISCGHPVELGEVFALILNLVSTYFYS